MRQDVAPPPTPEQPVSGHTTSPSYRRRHPHHYVPPPKPAGDGGGGPDASGSQVYVEQGNNDLRLETQTSDFIGTNSSSQSQVGTSSSLSETDGSSSQDFNQLHPAADIEAMNVKGGWTSQESATGEVSAGVEVLEELPPSPLPSPESQNSEPQTPEQETEQ